MRKFRLKEVSEGRQRRHKFGGNQEEASVPSWLLVRGHPQFSYPILSPDIQSLGIKSFVPNYKWVSAPEAAESVTYDHTKIEPNNCVLLGRDFNKKRWEEGQTMGGTSNQGPWMTKGSPSSPVRKWPRRLSFVGPKRRADQYLGPSPTV